MKTSDGAVSVKVRYPSLPAVAEQPPVWTCGPSGTSKRPPDPVIPIAPVHAPQAPQPSSAIPSQSSSAPWHASTGGTHAPSVHVGPQVWVPVEPHAVAQDVVLPRTQAKPSSAVPSQSSSPPLQTSAGGLHIPHAHDPEQVRDPVVPQLVMQLPDIPAQHAKPSSQTMLQSSSIPLHISAGGEHALQAQLALQVREPVLPQPVVHDA